MPRGFAQGLENHRHLFFGPAVFFSANERTELFSSFKPLPTLGCGWQVVEATGIEGKVGRRLTQLGKARYRWNLGNNPSIITKAGWRCLAFGPQPWCIILKYGCLSAPLPIFYLIGRCRTSFFIYIYFNQSYFWRVYCVVSVGFLETLLLHFTDKETVSGGHSGVGKTKQNCS